MRRLSILVAFIWGCFCGPWLLADFTGKVVAVADGDTVTVLRGTEQIKVRFDGIDAPERKQPFGTRARQFVADACFGETVTVREKGEDRYGRMIAVIEMPDGKSLNLQCVEAGFAWWYRKYAPDSRQLADAEALARQESKGLWADPSPIPPWDWRSGNTGGPVEAAVSQSPGEQTHWLTTSSQKRHNKKCRYYKETAGRPCGPTEGKPCKVCGG